MSRSLSSEKKRAKRSSGGDLITLKEYAERIGVDRKTVERQVKDGKLRRHESGLISIIDNADKATAELERKRHAARNEKLKADMQQIEYERIVGNLITADDAKIILREGWDIVKKYMKQLADPLSEKLVGCNKEEIYKRLVNVYNEMLTEVRNKSDKAIEKLEEGTSGE